MPLSEHEQRLLEQMERALMAEDPKFASSLRSGSSGSDRRRVIFGVIGALVGMAVLIAGVSANLPPLGIVGFLLMLAAVVMVVTGMRRPAASKTAPASTPGPAASKSRDKQSGFMNRFEQRWQERNRRDGRES